MTAPSSCCRYTMLCPMGWLTQVGSGYFQSAHVMRGRAMPPLLTARPHVCRRLLAGHLLCSGTLSVATSWQASLRSCAASTLTSSPCKRWMWAANAAAAPTQAGGRCGACNAPCQPCPMPRQPRCLIGFSAFVFSCLLAAPRLSLPTSCPACPAHRLPCHAACYLTCLVPCFA